MKSDHDKNKRIIMTQMKHTGLLLFRIGKLIDDLKPRDFSVY